MQIVSSKTNCFLWKKSDSAIVAWNICPIWWPKYQEQFATTCMSYDILNICVEGSQQFRILEKALNLKKGVPQALESWEMLLDC